MVQNAPGRFGAAITSGGPGLNVDGWFLGRLVLLNDPQGFIAGVKDFNTADDDALERIPAYRSQPSFACRLLRERREPIEIQSVAGHRPNKVRAFLLEHRVQGIGVSNMFFSKVVFVFTD